MHDYRKDTVDGELMISSKEANKLLHINFIVNLFRNDVNQKRFSIQLGISNLWDYITFLNVLN